jgi:hypothetical protein
MVTTYFGLTWWDNEIDGDKMYPPQQHNPREEQRYQALMRNPEGAAARGLWNDDKFLEQVGSAEFNSKLKTTQFADFHGHGWIFRAVFNHDRKGNWLDKDGKVISFEDPERFSKAVHLADIHLEKGMQWQSMQSISITGTAKFMESRAPRWKLTASIATAPFDEKRRS